MSRYIIRIMCCVIRITVSKSRGYNSLGIGNCPHYLEQILSESTPSRRCRSRSSTDEDVAVARRQWQRRWCSGRRGVEQRRWWTWWQSFPSLAAHPRDRLRVRTVGSGGSCEPHTVSHRPHLLLLRSATGAHQPLMG
jgi:hypothetical protein